ncbi:MAG: hypothetical protein KAJ75_05950 [Alphaproteobacteria bacterium]|nr:hypothetical protein [Alphaproteobacteria bacterium]
MKVMAVKRIFLSVVAFFVTTLPAFASKSVPEVIADYAPCWFCPIFDVVFRAVGTYSYRAYISVNEDALMLLTVGLLLWFSRKSMDVIGSVAEFDAADFWKQITARMFAGVIAAALLMASASEVYGYVMSPMIQGAVGFASAIIGGSCDGGGLSFTPMANSVFSEGTLNALSCIIDEMNKSVAKGVAVGWVTFIEGIKFELIPPKLPDINSIIGGLAIMIVFFAIIIMMPFYMVDACFRLGVVGALVPMFIVAWVFPSTKWFAKKGWAMLVNSMIVLICMCLVLGLISTMITDVLNSNPDLLNALNDPDPGHLADMMSLELLVLPKLIVAGIIGIFLIGKVPGIADNYSEMGSSGMNSMARVGGGMVTAIQAVAGSTARVGGKAAKRGIGKGVDKIQSLGKGKTTVNSGGSVSKPASVNKFKGKSEKPQQNFREGIKPESFKNNVKKADTDVNSSKQSATEEANSSKPDVSTGGSKTTPKWSEQ